MGESDSARRRRSIAAEGNGLHSDPLGPRGAKFCTSPDDGRKRPFGKFGVVLKALWPRDTAKTFARRARISVRTAKYRLSPRSRYRPSADELRIVIDEMLD